MRSSSRAINLQDYDISASNNNSTYTDYRLKRTSRFPITATVSSPSPTPPAYRYWRLSFSQRGASDPNYKIHEVYLASLLLDLNTDEKRPLHYRPSIPRTGLWRMRPTIRTLCSTTRRARRKPRSPFSGSIWTTILLMHLKHFGKVHPTPLSSQFIHVLTLNPTRST